MGPWVERNHLGARNGASLVMYALAVFAAATAPRE